MYIYINPLIYRVNMKQMTITCGINLNFSFPVKQNIKVKD